MELHRMTEQGLIQLQTDQFEDEAVVEDWLSKTPGVTIGGVDILLIHQQGHTNEGQRYDLLGLDKKGGTVTVELKHTRTPREIVAQALEYASDHHHWEQPYSTLEHRFQSYTGRTDSLRDAHAEYFRLENPRPETAFNTDQQIILLAGRFSDRVLSVAQYLQDMGHSIRCVEYNVFTGEDSRVLSTQNLLADETSKNQTNTAERPQPNKKYRTPTYKNVFGRIQSEVAPELGIDAGDDPKDILFDSIENMNGLSLVSKDSHIPFDHLEDDEEPFTFSFRVVPVNGKLRIAVGQRDDEVAKEILKSYQDKVRPDFEYKDRMYGTVRKEVDIDPIVAQIDWDTTTPEKIADVLLADESVNQYIEEFVEMIQVWHPRIVEAYPETLAEYNDEAPPKQEP